MLNLFDKKANSKNNMPISELKFFNGTDISDIHNNNNIGETKHYPPASKEWFNSIYSFNKNFIKTLPIADKIVNKLIKSYFNLNPLYNNKKSSRVQVRFKRLSLNRILVSRAEMKHTNNKVVITVYLYNKNKKFVWYKLKNLYKTFIFKVADVSKNLSTQNKPLKNTQVQTGLVKNKPNASLANKSVKINRANARNKFGAKITLLNLKKNLSKFSSKRFKNSSRARLAQQKARFIKPNYYINFHKLSQRNLKNFLLALNSAKKKNYGLKAKYESLIKRHYFFRSNNKLNTISNNNYFLNYVNIAKTNSSLKNNYLDSVEQGINIKPLSLFLLKKNSFFSTRLASGLAPSATLKIEAKNKNNYYKLFDKVKNTIAFEDVLAGTRKKKLSKAVAPNKTRKSPKKNTTFAGVALYKLRNLHKLFFISPAFLPYDGQLIRSDNSENIPQTDLGQAINSDIALKKRNFLLKNLYNILKNKTTLSKKNTTSAHKTVNARSLTLRLSLKKINSISLKGLRILKKARKNKTFLLKTLKWNNKNFINYETKYYKNFINKSYRKEILYLYYVKLLSLNNNKFKNWFILGLKRIISKIYHKKVEFNLVNLKYLHLNSDIFSESIAIKLRNRENRLLRVLKKALKLVKLPCLSKLSFYALPSEKTNINLNISRLKDKDILHELLYKIFPRWGVANTENSPINKPKALKNNLEENILNDTKHKNIYGVRLEAAGRLSRRLTASRSIFKLKYKGSLKNINSSYKGLSTVMLRGNTRSNIQLTKVSSKTRNGAFGLKGWISSN